MVTFNVQRRRSRKTQILLLAPAGVATINIHGTTIYSALRIRPDRKFTLISDRQRLSLRNKLSEVKLIIITDEISMVSSTLSLQVSQRSTKMFGCQDKPLARLPVIVW